MVKKLRIGVIFMLISSFLTATGQLMWKLSSNSILFLLVGFLFYGFGAIFMIKSFKTEKLIIIYPIMSIGYIISMFYGKFLLNESISSNKILAIILIIIGVLFNSYDK